MALFTCKMSREYRLQTDISHQPNRLNTSSGIYGKNCANDGIGIALCTASAHFECRTNIIGRGATNRATII